MRYEERDTEILTIGFYL